MLQTKAEERVVKVEGMGEEGNLGDLIFSGKSVGEPFSSYPRNTSEIDQLANYFWPHFNL